MTPQESPNPKNLPNRGEEYLRLFPRLIHNWFPPALYVPAAYSRQLIFHVSGTSMPISPAAMDYCDTDWYNERTYIPLVLPIARPEPSDPKSEFTASTPGPPPLLPPASDESYLGIQRSKVETDEHHHQAMYAQHLPDGPKPRTRSRTGCWTCRSRRIKCDEKRPFCTSCVTRGLKCAGYKVRLKWGNGVASRGALKGRSIPSQS
ncbi:predicted protein [Coccidioides posadasii str. Silveira]|uniref:Predicted protein n=1 Tax=Coccidioides posadasii (strain RMSCC 757 / Silveira) TaxID=443226 RepID=E9D532_COCPS|nr:predicted protein [Coccidioides posadasii str. Silveira]